SDLEAKQSQIGSMARKIESIQSSGEVVRTELESILSEADEKMDRLGAFYQTVDRMLEEAERVHQMEEQFELSRAESQREPATAGARKSRSNSSLSDWKKEGILSLYLNHKWEPDLIAERMKLDPAVVKAVIASNS
ncbi:MAG TPA: hypothetical protein DEA96_00240, partial [Leptospiraceae bacterium]|nr:hypothetical protein [Leptospiraceae bacterium]